MHTKKFVFNKSAWLTVLKKYKIMCCKFAIELIACQLIIIRWPITVVDNNCDWVCIQIIINNNMKDLFSNVKLKPCEKKNQDSNRFYAILSLTGMWLANFEKEGNWASGLGTAEGPRSGSRGEAQAGPRGSAPGAQTFFINKVPQNTSQMSRKFPIKPCRFY